MTSRSDNRVDSAPRMRGPAKVWILSAGIAATAAALWGLHLGRPSLLREPVITWWMLALGFYIAELAVVHLRFRHDAHSFSMSEIALVLGLFYAAPQDLLLGQMIGSAAVFVINRRLPLTKLTFNMSQFALQGALAVTVFRGVARLGDVVGAAGWLGAVSAALLATIVADLLINLAIRLTGGKVPWSDLLQVAGLSALAASMNASLGVSAVVVLTAAPGSVWLALLPPLILFLAYRAYVSQQQERWRLESLYEATRALHRSPQIEAALVAAAKDAIRMLDAEFAEILLFPERGTVSSYWTAVGPGDRLVVMEPVDLLSGAWERLIDRGKATLLDRVDAAALSLPRSERAGISEAVVAPLTRGEDVVGVIAVFNRLGDISAFGADEIPLLDTLANQLSVSLQNGRLEDSLAQLTDLKDKLEELIRSKDEFIASVSHELRTPLTAVVGLSHELHDNWATYEGSDAREMVDLIAGQSNELAHIIEDLLVAARADIGTLSLRPQEVDLGVELESVVSSHGAWSSRPVPEFTIESGAEVVWSDSLRLRQILRNLLTNAQRYGGSRVWITAERMGQEVAITVADDGNGVPEGHEETIFEPYRSAHEGRSPQSSVGLGLAVSRKLARLMDGDLVYAHADGVTTFMLTVPTAPAGSPLAQRAILT